MALAALPAALLHALPGSNWAQAQTSLASTEDPPPIFAALDFDAALAKAKAENRILVVKATASWCEPCKRMDRTTWRDEKVVQWFEAKAIAIQFDVDKQRELKQKLEIEAMPTMIAFVKGVEFDRIVGFQEPVDLLAWVEGVAAGKRSIEAVKSRAAQAPLGSEEEVDSRYDLAKDLLRSGKLAEATKEFAWLWEHSEQKPSFSGVRGSFMASDMQTLAKKHPPAKEHFARCRDELGGLLAAEKVARDDLSDWIVLNDVVGESHKTLEWFDKVKGDARWAPLLSSVEFRLERLLQAANRWADMVSLYRDPLAKVRSDHEFMLELRILDKKFGRNAEPANPAKEPDASRFHESGGKIYAALLAAGRDGEAAAIAEECQKLENTGAMRLALVRWALTAKQPRDFHAKLLDDAQSMGSKELAVSSLKRRLEKALGKPSER